MRNKIFIFLITACAVLETPDVATALAAGSDHGMVDRPIGRQLSPYP